MRRTTKAPPRADLVTAFAAAALVVVAVVVCAALLARGVPLRASFPPLVAGRDPTAGPGTLAADRRSHLLAVAAGLVLGGCLFLSYGLVLLAVPALAVLAHRRAWRVAVVAGAAVLLVVAAFALAGFAWWEGLEAVRGRYLDGYGGLRPYGYWVWANVAALVVVVGPATAVGLRRLATGRRPAGVRWLLGGMLAALALATLSGMSKAETERIWLPWSLWLPLACAALPAGSLRWWLGAQAVLAIALEHLLTIRW